MRDGHDLHLGRDFTSCMKVEGGLDLGREASTGALIYPQDRKSPEDRVAAGIHELLGVLLLFIQFSFGETKEKLEVCILPT